MGKLSLLRQKNPEVAPVELRELLSERSHALRYLLSKKYTKKPERQKQSFDQMFGFEEADFTKAHMRRGPMVDYTVGFVEEQHVPILHDLLRQNRERHGAILDMGCGQDAEAKYEFERNCQSIVYADSEMRELEDLERGFNFSPPPDGRRFLRCEKKDIVTHYARDTFALILRLGVYKAEPGEMEGYAHVLQEKGKLFVSNSIVRQPIQEFINHVEPWFSGIGVHIGLSRYALVCEPRKGG